MKPPVYSFTLLDQFFEVCPEQARRLYFVKDVKKAPATKSGYQGLDTHRELEQRIRHNRPLPAGMDWEETIVNSLAICGTLKAEVSLAVDKDLAPVDFWHERAWLRGKADAIMFHNGTAAILDWKDGKRREKVYQLEILAVLLLATHPSVNVVSGRNIWLKTREIGDEVKVTREDASRIWSKITRDIQAIEKLDPMDPWEKHQSPLCAYCPVRGCEHNRS